MPFVDSIHPSIHMNCFHRSLATRWSALAAVLTLSALLPAAKADTEFAFTGAATLRQEGGSLQLIDRANPGHVFAAVAIGDISGGVTIRGTGDECSLTVDASVKTGGIHFDGGAGKATLIGPGEDVSWHLTGASSGDLSDPAFLTFANVRNLTGAAGNQDVFVIAGGTLPGLVDGGAGGYDTMVIEGSHGSVVLGATAGDAGWVDLDGQRVDYAGLEPVNLGGPVANLTLDLSGLADSGILEATSNPGEMQLRTTTFTAETQIFKVPTNSLTVRLGGDDDTLQVSSLSSDFAADLTIDGQDGVDHVILSRALDLHGHSLTVIAETTEYKTPPFAPNGTAVATTGDQTTITLPATDLDGDTLTITSTTPDSHLTVDAINGLDVTFTAASDFAGATTLGYTVDDGLGGTASGTITITITDNDAPTITPQVGGFTPLLFFAGTMPDYRGQVTKGDNILVTDVTQDPAQGSPTTGSTSPVTVTLTAHDAAGNTADVSFLVDIRPQSAVNTAYLARGDDAPGAGTTGLPADAKLATFGTPAIDDDGHVSFVAKWTSATGGGAGLFFDDQCLAITPGTPPTSGASYVSFTDPVADGGKVACIATLKGVAKTAASVVLSNATGALEAIAQTGDIAPIADGTQPVGGAKFQAFKAVALANGSVGIFAQLTGGTGEEKATAATDLGLWIKSGANPLRRVLREGKEISAGKFVGTLTSFGAGAGSPGQGRGWLEVIGGIPAVLARVVYTDKSQAVLSARLLAGTVSITTLLDTDAILPGAALVTGLGLPATNRFAEVALLTSTASESGARPGVTVKHVGTDFTRSAVVGAPSPVAGAKFSALKDPVLAADGGVAFPATVKGGAAKGNGVNTLWWLPPGQPLTLLAQGGTRPSLDLPVAAQWKTFTSLAIAEGRGPIFTATLVPNKGGVTKSAATGAWGVDFTGAVRLLFRTGDMIGGKTLQSFTLLKTSVGSTGVTRSFNNAAQVVWLATFKEDKSQAIITTQVP
jgi:hypothetical protein